MSTRCPLPCLGLSGSADKKLGWLRRHGSSQWLHRGPEERQMLGVQTLSHWTISQRRHPSFVWGVPASRILRPPEPGNRRQGPAHVGDPSSSLHAQRSRRPWYRTLLEAQSSLRDVPRDPCALPDRYPWPPQGASSRRHVAYLLLAVGMRGP